jgi:hypothetical protein
VETWCAEVTGPVIGESAFGEVGSPVSVESLGGDGFGQLLKKVDMGKGLPFSE